MNWINRIQSIFAPKADTKPKYGDVFGDVFDRNLRSAYDAAATTPQNEKYWASADYNSPRAATNHGTRKKIRARSRYECLESNSYARGMVLTKVGDVIGTGPRLQITDSNSRFSMQVENEFAMWARAINLPQKLRTMCSAKIVDGEAFAERITNRTLPTPVKLDLRLSEADLWSDRLFTDSFDPLEQDGIRFDQSGNPVRYRRQKYHPGDDHNRVAEFDYDDLSPDDVIHWYRADRPDQKRGIAEFAAALPLFAELRRWIMATIAAAEAAAEFAAIVESTASAFQESPAEVEKGFTYPINRRAMAFMPRGWTMKQFKAEHPNAQFEQFEESILRQIARCLVMPLNIASGSSRRHNFASGRLDYLLWWNQCDQERGDCEIVVLDKIFKWWLEEARLVNDYLPPVGAGLRHRWYFPARRPIDEVAAARAQEILWNLGHKTDYQIFAEQAIDSDDHYRQLAAQTQRRNAINENFPQPGIRMNESIVQDQPEEVMQ